MGKSASSQTSYSRRRASYNKLKTYHAIVATVAIFFTFTLINL